MTGRHEATGSLLLGGACSIPVGLAAWLLINGLLFYAVLALIGAVLVFLGMYLMTTPCRTRPTRDVTGREVEGVRTEADRR